MRALSTARWIAVGVLGLAIVAPAWYLVAGGRTLAEIDGGSMVPTFHVGDVVVDAPIDADDLRVGMIITVKDDDGQYFTHRLEQIEPDGGLRLKGDANAAEDDTIRRADQVVGRVEMVLPRYVGGFLIQLQTWPFRISLFVTMIGLALLPIRRFAPARPALVASADLLHTGEVLPVLPLLPLSASSTSARGVL